jgi:transposase InsO family protein
MTEAVFAGSTVGPDGIKPDLTKLTAIVNWEQPTVYGQLESFLGLTGYFRGLIKNYSRIAQPLTDLKHNSRISNNIGKGAYRKEMKMRKILGAWTAKHTKCFLDLKALLMSDPVLKGPRFDGSPFIVITDGSGRGFRGVLCQRFKTKLPNGKEVTRIHPIAFASKRTSPTEEKYKSFLLEFAALKFSLDKFSDIIWGFPIEIETDCQALWDMVMNDKLSPTHTRWRDGIINHHIIDVRHIPGKINVSDGISRKWAHGSPCTDMDGSNWTVNPDWEERTGLVHDIFTTLIDNGQADMEDPLEKRFVKEPLFLQVILAIWDKDHAGPLRDRKKARHRALDYLIEDGHLWHVGGKKSVRARARKECVTEEEATVMASEEHTKGGHFKCDLVKMQLMDKIKSPHLDRSILKAIRDCGRCKNFGNTHLHSLLEPITRRHPWELLVGNYLSISKGIGGFTYLGVYLKAYSQHIFVFKHKKVGTGKTTVEALWQIGNAYTDTETFMVDGGSHFNNAEVREFCAERGIKLHTVAAYSAWINGLVEGTNKILLGVLKRLCAPDLGEDEYALITDFTHLPKNWPKYLNEAVRQLNNRILPSLHYSPKELALGLVVNTNRTRTDIATTELTTTEVENQLAYVEQQELNGYSQITAHAERRRAAFNRRLNKRAPGEVIFYRGDLVQVYRSDLDFTFKTSRKLTPRWSPPFRVKSQIQNSYKLETLNGSSTKGEYSSRHLRKFHPREGTNLAADQEQYMKELKDKRKEGDDDKGEEAERSDTEDDEKDNEDKEEESKEGEKGETDRDDEEESSDEEGG